MGIHPMGDIHEKGDIWVDDSSTGTSVPNLGTNMDPWNMALSIFFHMAALS